MANANNSTVPINDKETWKPVVGYEGVYSVSHRGRVRRDLPAKNGLGAHPGIRKATLDSYGYPQLNLCKDGKVKTWKVHALVTAAFIGPRPEGMEVNHKDANKANNTLENLEYCTTKANIHHAIQAGIHSSCRKGPSVTKKATAARGARNGRYTHPESTPRGSQHPCHKLTEENVLLIRAIHAKGGHTYVDLAQAFNVDPAQISRIIRRKNWKHI